GFYLHGAEAAFRLWPAGLVADGVLIADVMSDRAADVIHFREVFWEIGDAAGLQRQALQGAAGALGVAIIAEQTDGINGWAGIALHATDSFFERIAAGIVFAVGDDEQNLLFELCALRLLLGSRNYR